MTPKTNPGKNVQSVQRAVDIINCFSSANAELSLGEISAMLDLNKGTVHGIIKTLLCNDFIYQSRSGKYLLGPAFFSKASLAGNTLTTLFVDAARQPMQALSDRYCATGNLFCIRDSFPHLIHDSEPHNTFFLLHKVRPEMPPYAAASAKLALAYADDAIREKTLRDLELTPLTPSTITDHTVLREHLAQIRRQGYSYEQDEFFEGVSALSVPILNGDALFGMLSLTGMSANIHRNQSAIVADLRQTVSDIRQSVAAFSARA